MHAKYYQRRLPHAGRELIFGRQIVGARDDDDHKDGPAEEDDDVEDDVAEDDDAEDEHAEESDHHHVDEENLPHPVTLTIVQTLPIATSASTTQWTTVTSLSTVFSSIDTATKIASTSTSASTTTTTPATSTASNTSSSSTFISTVPSGMLPAASPTTTQTGTNSEAQSRLSATSAHLSAGGIAGIIIGCLTVFAAIFLFFLRRRFIAERQRSTGAWTRRTGSISPFTFGAAEPKFTPAPVPQNLKPLQLGRDVESRHSSIPTVTLPPMAVNSPTSFYSSSHDPSFIQPVPTGGTFNSSSTGLMTVMCSFNVTLPDELSITVGEKMKVVARYDDGWALCTKTNGEQGMVPLECLEEGIAATTNGLRVPVETGGGRISSLLSTGTEQRVADN